MRMIVAPFKNSAKFSAVAKPLTMFIVLSDDNVAVVRQYDDDDDAEPVARVLVLNRCPRRPLVFISPVMLDHAHLPRFQK